MGCGSSVGKHVADADAVADDADTAKAAADAQEQRDREREDSEQVFKQFQDFLAAKLLQLTAARDDIAAELRSHSKHDSEYKRTQTAVSHALGALSSLSAIEEERERRKNVDDSGTEKKTWVCATCTTENPTAVALCNICSRKRYPDEGPKSMASVDHATVLRKQHLLVTAKEQMTGVAATAAAAKMLVVNKRRLRALRTVLKFLDDLGKIDASSELMREIVADAETEMMESEMQMLLLDRTLADRVMAKTTYLRAKGALDFVLDFGNSKIFQDWEVAKRAAIQAFNAAENAFVNKVVAPRDGIKATKDRVATASVRLAAVKSVRDGTYPGKVSSSLKDEELELVRRTTEWVVGAAVYKDAAPSMYAALGALEYLVDWKQMHEKTAYELDLEAVLDGSNIGVEKPQRAESMQRTALHALQKLRNYKERMVSRAKVEALAINAASYEGVINIARLARLQELSASNGLTLVQNFATLQPAIAKKQLELKEKEALAELTEADKSLRRCGGEEMVLDRARDAKGRMVAAQAALLYVQDAWDTQTNSKSTGTDEQAAQEESALYHTWHMAGAEERSAAAANELAEHLATAVLSGRRRRAEAVGRITAVRRLRKCIAMAEVSPGSFDARLWRAHVPVLLRATQTELHNAEVLLTVGTSAVHVQQETIAEMHKLRGLLLGMNALHGGEDAKRRNAKVDLIIKGTLSSGLACASIGITKALKAASGRGTAARGAVERHRQRGTIIDRRLHVISEEAEVTADHEQERLLTEAQEQTAIEVSALAASMQPMEQSLADAALAKNAWYRCIGAVEFVARATETTVQIASDNAITNGDAPTAEDDSFTPTGHITCLGDNFLVSADSKRSNGHYLLQPHQQTQQGHFVVEYYGSEYAEYSRTVRLGFITNKALKNPRYEAMELEACRILMQDLKAEAEELIIYQDQFVTAEKNYQLSLERQAIAVEGDDIEEEDDADRWVEHWESELHSSREHLHTNRACPSLYKKIAIQVAGRLGPEFELDEFEKAVLWTRAKALAAGQARAGPARQRKAAEKDSENLYDLLVRARKSRQSALYKAERQDDMSRKAGNKLDMENEKRHRATAAECREKAESKDIEIAGLVMQHDEAEGRAREAKAEAIQYDVVFKQAEKDCKEASEAAKAGWFHQMEERMKLLATQTDPHPLEQIKFKEAHDQFKLAVTGWRYIEEHETDSELAIHALCSGFCAGLSFQAAKDLVRGLIDKWLSFNELSVQDVVANYDAGDLGHVYGSDNVLISQFMAAEGLYRLVCGEYASAANIFVAITEDLGQTLRNVVSASDIGLYGTLCALASFNHKQIREKVLDNRFFRRYLDKNLKAKRLVTEMYAQNYVGVAETLAILDDRVKFDMFLSDHRDSLFDSIMQTALNLYSFDSGPFINTTALYDKDILFNAVESETAARGQTLRSAMAATDGKMARLKLAALRADLTLTLHQASGSNGDDEDGGISRMMETIDDTAFSNGPLHEFVQKYKHARKRMDAAIGALVFMADVRAIQRIRGIEEAVHRAPPSDEPRTSVPKIDVVRAVSNLKMAVLGLGRSAASHEAKNDSRHRVSIFQSALSAVSAVRAALRSVSGTTDAVMAIGSLVKNQEKAIGGLPDLEKLESDLRGTLLAARASIRKHHRECGLLDFLEHESRQKQDEEAAARLKAKTESRMRVRMKTRLKEQIYKKATSVAMAAAAAEAEAFTTLQEMIAGAEQMKRDSEISLSKVVHARQESSVITSLFALKQHARIQVNLEQDAAVSNSRYEVAKSCALRQQELHETRIGMAKVSATKAQQALQVLTAAQQVAKEEQAKRKKDDVVNLMRNISGRVDTYGVELAAVRKTSRMRVDAYQIERDRCVAAYHAAQSMYRSAALAHDTLLIVNWLRDYLQEMYRRRIVERDQEAKFRKVRKATRGIRMRHNLARKGADLYYYAPARKQREDKERTARQRATAAAKEDATAQLSLDQASGKSSDAEHLVVEAKHRLQKIDYQADRAFRAVKIARKKLDKKVEEEQQAKLDDLRAAEEQSRQMLEKYTTEFQAADEARQERQAEADATEEQREQLEGEHQIATAETEQAVAQEQQVQKKAVAKIDELLGAGFRFVHDDFELRFKELLMMKMLDGDLGTVWTNKEEREFRSMFVSCTTPTLYVCFVVLCL